MTRFTNVPENPAKMKDADGKSIRTKVTKIWRINKSRKYIDPTTQEKFASTNATKLKAQYKKIDGWWKEYEKLQELTQTESGNNQLLP